MSDYNDPAFWLAENARDGFDEFGEFVGRAFSPILPSDGSTIGTVAKVAAGAAVVAGVACIAHAIFSDNEPTPPASPWEPKPSGYRGTAA